MLTTTQVTKELDSRWHSVKREVRRIEEGFVLDFLILANPTNAMKLYDELCSDAQEALIEHLSSTRHDYWSELGVVGVIPYDPNAESDEERKRRFLATIDLLLNTIR